MPNESETERLREIQRRRAEQEARASDQAPDPDEKRTHERRADKAAYLREKLDEQAQAPDEHD